LRVKRTRDPERRQQQNGRNSLPTHRQFLPITARYVRASAQRPGLFVWGACSFLLPASFAGAFIWARSFLLSDEDNLANSSASGALQAADAQSFIGECCKRVPGNSWH
jgi:hypothetical protein